MKVKKSIIMLIFFLLFICLITNKIYAVGELAQASVAPSIDDITGGMKGVGNVTVGPNDSSIMNAINAIIKLLQITGSGISIVVVTMLGGKYMLASAGEKADIKKQAIPIIVGCVILFAAVNLVAIVAGIGTGLNS